MSAGLEIRDPIHGFIHRDLKEKKIVDSKVFQRLRRLKQLAMASLVYPGAVHTRFDHSLGAFHVARQASTKLLPNSSADQELVRLAALLHDIGHGPFSHVSEPILKEFCKIELDLKKYQIHEIISSRIILENSELLQILGENQCQEIVSLLEGKLGDSLLKDIISGPLDVDKQDYLLRDSYFCGVQYGVYDPNRLLDALTVHQAADDERYLAISGGGVNSVEQFVLAKYYMSAQVYFHKIRLITDSMIGRGIALGIKEDKIPWLKDLYSYDGSPEHLREYLDWHDEKLVLEILSNRTPDGYAKRIFTRLADRNLLKRIFSVKENRFENPALRLSIFDNFDKFRGPLEDLVSATFGYEKELVIANLVNFKPATRTESEIMVLGPKPVGFREESVLFSSVDEAIKEQRIEIYAPAIYDDRDNRRKRERDFHEQIFEMIIKLANPQTALPLGPG